MPFELRLSSSLDILVVGVGYTLMERSLVLPCCMRVSQFQRPLTTTPAGNNGGAHHGHQHGPHSAEVHQSVTSGRGRGRGTGRGSNAARGRGQGRGRGTGAGRGAKQARTTGHAEGVAGPEALLGSGDGSDGCSDADYDDVNYIEVQEWASTADAEAAEGLLSIQRQPTTDQTSYRGRVDQRPQRKRTAPSMDGYVSSASLQLDGDRQQHGTRADVVAQRRQDQMAQVLQRFSGGQAHAP